MAVWKIQYHLPNFQFSTFFSQCEWKEFSTYIRTNFIRKSQIYEGFFWSSCKVANYTLFSNLSSSILPLDRPFHFVLLALGIPQSNLTPTATFTLLFDFSSERPHCGRNSSENLYSMRRKHYEWRISAGTVSIVAKITNRWWW